MTEVLLVVLGAVLALGGSMYSTWRTRVATRRIEILMVALPDATASVANTAKGLNLSKPELDRLQRLALTASRGDDAHAKRLVRRFNAWKAEESQHWEIDRRNNRVPTAEWRRLHDESTRAALDDLLAYDRWLAGQLRPPWRHRRTENRP